MARLSDSLKKSLVEATSRYRESLPGSPAEEYLASRGLMAPSVADEVAKYRLGYVDDPVIGHELYRGRLAVPYLRRASDGAWSVVGMKFRCVVIDCEQCREKQHQKYLALSGGKPRLYNTRAIVDNDDEIGISEGELDALTASVCGIPTVGVPGAESWKDHFLPPFEGYETVYVFADGDDPGMRFATSVAKKLSNAKVVPMDRGEDVNSTVLKHGKGAFLAKLGKRPAKGNE